MPPRPQNEDATDAETRGDAEDVEHGARIAVGFAVATVVTAVPSAVIATVAVVTV